MTALLRPAVLAPLAVLALLAGACGEEAVDTAETDVAEETPADDAAADDDATDDDATDDDATDDATTDDATTDDAAGDVEVATADGDLGEILVDGDGMTLYMFEPDDAGASTCYDECAENWPPLVVDDAPAAGTGIDEDLLGTTERDDGSLQVTYDGWPLYYWVGDDAPGDTNGQGVNEVWWVLDADGTPLDGEGLPPDDEDEDDDDNGGYSY